VPLVLGSRSTYPLGALGGLDGRALRAGDTLPLGVKRKSVPAGRAVPAEFRPGRSAPVQLRVLPGLYNDRVTEESAANFYADTWKVAPEADRIGYRFRGGHPIGFVPRVPPFGAGSDPSNVVDCCYPYGSIQIPGGTEPIVLHRDAVSGGGYFMLGAVISADMDLIGQMQPHTPTRFVQVDMATALEARHDRRRRIERLRNALA
jgi:allophanate hydrolase subunit 2